ncbi:hypothetical protein DFJ74DRAFT_272995 [Hyaloraphidium curvatum]|nr:hypothetical protein DFJ74DRAFT_272995 [Hyaloraphidium curvatum]
MSRLSNIVARIRDPSLSALLLSILGLALALATWDVFWKSFEKDNRSLFTFGAALVLLVVSVFLIVLSRLVSARSALADIPKVYIPINRTDLSKKQYEMISEGLAFTESVRARIKPLPQDIPDRGWGRKGTSFEGVFFETACAATLETISQHAASIDPDLALGDRPISARDYIEELVAGGILDEEPAMYYIDLYEKARWSGEEVLEKDYVEMLKVVVLLCSGKKEDGEDPD